MKGKYAYTSYEKYFVSPAVNRLDFKQLHRVASLGIIDF
jgi:hypothetical protein